MNLIPLQVPTSARLSLGAVLALSFLTSACTYLEGEKVDYKSAASQGPLQQHRVGVHQRHGRRRQTQR